MSVRRRLTSLVIALLVHLLILVALLQLAPVIPGKPDVLTTFDLAPSADDELASRELGHQAAPASAPPQPSVIKPTIAPPALPPSALPSNPTPLPIAEPAAADVSTPPGQGESAGNALAGAGAGGGTGGGDSVAGSGPHGAPLYKAEWYREPTHDELSFYIQDGVRKGGWAEIACQTAPRFRVRHCQPLGDSPPGSGLAQAIVGAAWQFRVRPPLVDGKPMIGGWVRIRIDFSVGKDGR